MLDVLAFFSPAFALARWISAHVPDLSAIFVPLSEEMTEAWDIGLAIFGTLLPFFLFPPVFLFVYKAVHLLFDPGS